MVERPFDTDRYKRESREKAQPRPPRAAITGQANRTCKPYCDHGTGHEPHTQNRSNAVPRSAANASRRTVRADDACHSQLQQK